MTEHGRGSAAREEPLTPEDTPAPSHAERARTLVARRSVGCLGTLCREPAGYPYGSFVTFAMDGANPVLLLSALATHTKNLVADPRASLMVSEEVAADPLANPRLTLVGDCRRVDPPGSARDAFLAAHPGAAHYADFTDFAFYQLTVRSLRYIGGYGRMSWIDVTEWRGASPDPIAPHAAELVEHMNGDHADALVLYARAFTRATGVERCVMTGVDRYGFEMSVTTERGPRPARLAFQRPIATPAEAREALVSLVKEARAKLA